MSTATMSFSLDEATKKGIEEFARERNISRSGAVKELYRIYKLQTLFLKAQDEARPLARKLGIKTEEDVERIFG